MTPKPETASKWVEELKQLADALTINGPTHWSTPVHAERFLYLITAQDALTAQLAGALKGTIDGCKYLQSDGWMEVDMHGDEWRAAIAALTAYEESK